MSELVVDTSVWIHFFSGKTLPELESALQESRVVLTPIVLAELLSGQTAGDDDLKLIEFLEDLEMVETPSTHWIEVGRLRKKCLKKGLRVSTPDAHIAQSAIDRKAVVYSFDDVFTKIAKILPLKVL